MSHNEDLERALLQVKQQFNENSAFADGLLELSGHQKSEPHHEEVKLHEQIVARPFGDIARSGPQNAKEEELFIKAQITLEPQEFKGLVQSNASYQEVSTKVNNSEMARQLQELQIAESSPIQKEQEKELEAPPAKDKQEGLLSLGEEFGILKEIAKALRETKIVDMDEKAPKAPSPTPGAERGPGAPERTR